MTPLTWDQLLAWHPCTDAVTWGRGRYGDVLPTVPVIITDLMMARHHAWANWLIVWRMTYPQYVAYAVYAAEQVIDLYERTHPDDSRPRQAIAAARHCLVTSSDADKRMAEAAAWTAAEAAAEATEAAGVAGAAEAATAAADAAAGVARAAEVAAWAAAMAAEAAAWAAAGTAAEAAAWAAARMAAEAAGVAGAAEVAADIDMFTRILRYGLQLLMESKGQTARGTI